jgi:hypothetical protein
LVLRRRFVWDPMDTVLSSSATEPAPIATLLMPVARD